MEEQHPRHVVWAVSVSVIVTLGVVGIGLHLWKKSMAAEVQAMIARETQKNVHEEIVSLAAQAGQLARASYGTALSGVEDCNAFPGSWSRYTINEDFYLSFCYKNIWGVPVFGHGEDEESPAYRISFPDQPNVAVLIQRGDASSDAEGSPCWSCLDVSLPEEALAERFTSSSGQTAEVRKMQLRASPMFRVAQAADGSVTRITYLIPETLKNGEYYVAAEAALPDEEAHTMAEDVSTFVASFDF